MIMRPGPPRLTRYSPGYPGPEARERARRGEVILDGCMATDLEPRWVLSGDGTDVSAETPYRRRAGPERARRHCLSRSAPLWASRQLTDVAWMSAATAAERRAATRVLGSWVTGAHDAVLLLSQVGDQSSIPHLRAFLARQPNGEGDTVSCTWTHAREALDRLEPPARPRRR